MTEPIGMPAYQQVAADLRQLIAAGDLPVGSAIPSTNELTRRYEVSSTVARAAVNICVPTAWWSASPARESSSGQLRRLLPSRP